MAKIRQSTIQRVVNEAFCDVGKYRYILHMGAAGWAYIRRRDHAKLDVLPVYGPVWETVAVYDPADGEWHTDTSNYIG